LRRFRFLAALVGLLVVSVALALWLRPDSPTPPDGAGADDENIDQVLTVTNPGYVGIEVCAECHAPRAAVVKTSRHYFACRPALDGAAAPGFAPDRGVCTTRDPDLRFEMTRTGNSFFANRVRVTAQGEQQLPYPLDLVYGSGGKHDEKYFSWQGDQLVHLPVAWLYPFGRWGVDVNTTTARPTHSSCLECHNTWVAHVPGTVNRYRREGMLLGVTCERCHGPGREHVNHHRAHPDDQEGRKIVHPGRLNRERKMDLCAQCHANAKRFAPAFSYRPGEPLDAYFHNAKPTYREDDTTNQVRYLSESKCFQKSAMTCLTCHDPHRPGSARGGCLNCHTVEKCTDRPHLPAAVRDDCVGCHMPARIWTHAHLYSTADEQYLPLAPRAEHRIGVYPEAKQTVLLAWLRAQNDDASRAESLLLSAKITQFWLNEGTERVRVGRLRGAIGAFREGLRIGPDPTTREHLRVALARQLELDGLTQALRETERAEEAVPLLKKMLEVNPSSAFAHGELGAIYARTGNPEEARIHLRAVARYEPTDSFGLTWLAEMALRDGRTDEAAALCAEAEQINPVSVLNRHIWGLVLLKQERWPDAEKQFRKVLLSDPTHTGSNAGLSDALRRQGDAREAVRFARRAVHWNKGPNAELLLTLADAYTAAKRSADAHATLTRALAVAEETAPPLVPTIRNRLRALGGDRP
jgi:tetratricopeptide (TPR) repeat protein